jgi:hypothetical protein
MGQSVEAQAIAFAASICFFFCVTMLLPRKIHERSSRAILTVVFVAGWSISAYAGYRFCGGFAGLAVALTGSVVGSELASWLRTPDRTSQTEESPNDAGPG